MQPTDPDHRNGGGKKASLVPFVVVTLCALSAVWVLRRLPQEQRPSKPTETLQTVAVAPSPPSTSESESTAQPVAQAENDETRQSQADFTAKPPPSRDPQQPREADFVDSTNRRPEDPSTNEPLKIPRNESPEVSRNEHGVTEPSGEADEMAPDGPRPIQSTDRPAADLSATPTKAALPAWRKRLDELVREYGIQVIWTGDEIASEFSRKLRGRLSFPSEERLEQHVPFIVSEIKRYPVEVVRKARLERIVLCCDLSVDLYTRAGLAVPSEHTLYLDLGGFDGAQEQVRLVIHHEIFHLIDDPDDETFKGDAWKQLNPAGFKYKQGTSGASDDPTVLLAQSAPVGFVSKYSTVAVYEDKAEVFAHLMADTEGLTARASGDTVVANKVRRMERLLERFGGGKKFWVTPRLPDTIVRQPRKEPPSSLPKDWPPFKRALSGGNYIVRIHNPNPSAVNVGLRTSDRGVDLLVPASGTKTAQVPPGVYKVFFYYEDKREEVYQGDDVTLSPPHQGVEIRLVAVVDGNYRLRRHRQQ